MPLKWDRFHVNNDDDWPVRRDGTSNLTAPPAAEFCLLLNTDTGAGTLTVQLNTDTGTNDHCVELNTSTM